MTFKDILTESPVGKVGRTTHGEAMFHIQNSDAEKEFFKIVNKIGGKTVAKALLNNIKEPKNEFENTGDIYEI